MVNRPSRDWRKRSHRLQESRDEFKARNRDKAEKVKILEGKALDLERSRSQWKEKCKEKTREIKRLTDEVAEKDELIEAERKLRQQEIEMHSEELEQLKKNGSCCNNAPRRKRSQNPSPTLFGSFCPDLSSIGSFRRLESSWSESRVRALLFLAETQNAFTYCDSGLDFASRVLQTDDDSKFKGLDRDDRPIDSNWCKEVPFDSRCTGLDPS